MLQLDSYSRNRRPVADFVSRNRRAVKAIKTSKPSAATKKEREASRPPASKPSRWQKKPTTERSERHSDNGGKSGGDTVVISKDYLDSLLKMNAGKSLEGGGDSRKIEGTGSCHRVVSPSDVPGLQGTGGLHHDSQGHGIELNPARNGHHKELSTTTSSEHYKELNTINRGHPKEPGHVGNRRRKGQESAAPEVVEEYFPFGRPGCGAPLRTASGHIMADLRALNVQKSQELRKNDPDLSSLREPPQQRKTTEPGNAELASNIHSNAVDIVSPRFARGVGPHVDQYMLREIADKRKKELEHKSFLKEQMEAKQRAKREAKERAEREEREEETRLAVERRKQLEEYRRDMERAAKKEEDSRRRQMKLQDAIEKAAQEAEHIKHSHKTVARRHTNYRQAHDTPTHHSVTFDLPHSSASSDMMDRSSSRHHHQPSHRSEETTPPVPPTHTSQRQQHRLKNDRRRGSRIPLSSRAIAKGDNANKRKLVVGVSPVAPVKKHGHHSNHSSSNHTVPDYHNNSSSSNMISDSQSSWMGDQQKKSVPIRPASPPVPALARRIKQQQQQENDASPPRQQWGTANGAGHHGDDRRGDGRRGDGYHSDGGWDKQQDIPLNSTFVPREASQVAAASHATPPPVPAVSRPVKTESTLPPVATQCSSLTHAHTPSNSSTEGVTLPTLVARSSGTTDVARHWDGEDSQQQHRRQQAILQQLAQLRSGLLSHCSQVDVKLDTLLNTTTSYTL